ncbi:hypothetical protein CesoFtcFv8_013531 [Champsocephalus esox]|uniref:Uncharacterized protein n=1 Tax=Champsocephalus esox TaxID=159716 RepID=A0AAN8GTT2_9TELE|nr:hypothetical protein CesoFtcFv8_013531 [Champsocephalus esox]
MSKKRKKKSKRKGNNVEEYEKEDIESGGTEGRGDEGSDETSEPDGKRSYAEAEEEHEGVPVEEQSGSVKVEKGPDGERGSRDVSVEAAKTALKHEKRQVSSSRGEAKLK